MNSHTRTPALNTRAMLVSLKVSQWSARKLDRRVTDEINSSRAASRNAGRYNKQLIDKKFLEPIDKIVTKTRNEFVARTLPWMDDGQRIMSSEAYFEYITWFNQRAAMFEEAVQDFIGEYDNHVNFAREQLNGMFNPNDYPDADALKQKFSIKSRVMPVQAASDFRVAMSEAQAEIIRHEIEQEVQEATNIAVSDIYRRMHKCCSRMVERLNAFKPSDGPGTRAENTFKDSLVENVRDLLSIIPSLNITGDIIIDQLATDMQGLAKYDAKQLRENDGIRKNVAQQAQSLLDRVGEYF